MLTRFLNKAYKPIAGSKILDAAVRFPKYNNTKQNKHTTATEYFEI